MNVCRRKGAEPLPIEQRFADESVLPTYLIYLEAYKTFRSPEQLKRIVSLLHRQAIKAKSDALFFKVRIARSGIR